MEPVRYMIGASWELPGNPCGILRVTGTTMLLAALLQAEQASGLSGTLSASPLLAVATLFGAGVLTSLTPCIYPMIPITVSVISGTARDGQSKGRTAGLTLTYVVGLATFYAILGLVAGLTGTLFGTVSASPWALLAMGNLLLLFALFMLDVFPVPVPRRLMSWAAEREGGSYGAVFLLGATSGIVAAPCGAPAFAVVLTWVAATGAGLMGFVYLFVFSLGMTALLVVVGLFSGVLAVLPRSGTWMVWVKKGAGIVLIAVAQYYFVKAGYSL
jgi:cytochrome c-type biogenesis protein